MFISNPDLESGATTQTSHSEKGEYLDVLLGSIESPCNAELCVKAELRSDSTSKRALVLGVLAVAASDVETPKS